MAFNLGRYTASPEHRGSLLRTLENTDIVSEQQAGLPTDHFVRSEVPKSAFLWAFCGPFCIAFLGPEGKENCRKYADAHATFCVVNNKVHYL